MPSIGTALSDCLRSVERPGDFYVGGLREIFMPAIDVDGVGRIAFPLLSVQVERLVAIAEAAPYGRGEETVVDRDVRSLRMFHTDNVITAVDVMLDDQRLGEAHYGLARQDVGTAFPDWVDSLRSGYAFQSQTFAA